MNETTFENAKVGDRVWSSIWGWGSVVNIKNNLIKVCFDQTQFWFDFYGICLGHIQTLFWDEIKFEVPPRPKRKVKRVVEGWVNVLYAPTGWVWPYAFNGAVYKDNKEALSNRITGYTYLGEPLFIRHEYEVEE